jgi:hypothetical protein
MQHIIHLGGENHKINPKTKHQLILIIHHYQTKGQNTTSQKSISKQE